MLYYELRTTCQAPTIIGLHSVVECQLMNAPDVQLFFFFVYQPRFQKAYSLNHNLAHAQ